MQFREKSRRSSHQEQRHRLFSSCLAGIKKVSRWMVRSKPVGVTLGKYVKGDHPKAIWIGRKREVVLPIHNLRRHLVILGSGLGEEKLLQSALAGVAEADRSIQVLFFDGYGDRRLASSFEATMAESGRERTLLFPERPFNGWAGNWRLLSQRLLEIMPCSQGDGAFYRSQVGLVLKLACLIDGELPRTHDELLERLNYKKLLEAHGEQTLASIDKRCVESVRMRCAAFFAVIGDAFDGDKSFAELDAAYFSLDPLTLGPDAESATRVLLSQLLSYVQEDKDHERLCVAFLRIPVRAVDIAPLLEVAYAHGLAIVLILQSLADLGDAIDAGRALQNTGVVVAQGFRASCEVHTAISPFRYSSESGAVLSSSVPSSRTKVTKKDLLEPCSGQAWIFTGGLATLTRLS